MTQHGSRGRGGHSGGHSGGGRNGGGRSSRGGFGGRNDRRSFRDDAGRGGFRSGEQGRRDDRAPRPRRDAWDEAAAAERAERRAERMQDRRETEQGREAVRRAARQRPEGGYSLADFDDIPFNPDHRPAAAAPAPERSTEGVRLQKALANAGVASRRVCEDLITKGKVLVNGKRVTELGTRIDPERDKVVVDGTPVQFDQSKRYLILNKPVGVVSTMRDEQGRPDLRRYTKQYPERLYNVGRLDAETSGLLILTNDGELAHVLAHPSFGVTKTYVAKVRGLVTARTIHRLLEGIELEDGPIKADSAHLIQTDRRSGSSLVELTLHSGRNRIVRRMLDHVGHPVEELVRRSFGPLHLGSMREGELRELGPDELGKLLKLARRAEAAAERERGGTGGENRTGGDHRTGRGGRPRRDDGGGRRDGGPRGGGAPGGRGGGAPGSRGSNPRGTGGTRGSRRRDDRDGGPRR